MLPPKGKPPYRRSFVWGPGGHHKSIKNDMEKRVSQRGSQRSLWGPMGSPRAPKGSQMGAKRLPKELQKVSKMRLQWKTAKCKENILYTTLRALPPLLKSTHFEQFWGPKRSLESERGKRAINVVPGRAQSGTKAENGAPQGPKWIPKGSQNPSKIELGAPWGADGPQRAPK